MIYQKLLMNEHPYFVHVSDLNVMEKHRHPDIEINFCLGGTYTVKIDNSTFDIHKGDLIVASPMAAHEILRSQGESSLLVIVVGTTLLSEYFEYFRN